jgi:peptidoglycan/xylan/chitin deacetylase (PgdA/CDA1 family)
MMLHGVGEGGPSVPAFRASLQWLRATFTVVSLGEMVDAVEQGRPPSPGGEVAVTFDDGLRNQREQAYPILRELKVPATIFVCPGLIERQAWMWNHDVRGRLARLTRRELSAFAHRAGTTQAKPHDIVEAMKHLPAAMRRALHENIQAATPGFVPSAAEHAANDLMSWDELRSLDPEWITIGSHTMSHPILPQLDDEELEFEISQSRQLLEVRLKRPVELFCYPNGASDPRAHHAVASHYRAAVTTQESRVVVGVDRHAIPRMAMDVPTPQVAWRMMRCPRSNATNSRQPPPQ